MKVKSALMFVLLGILACSTAVAVDNKDANEKEKAATEATQQWLKIADAGSYGESWDEAATIFKEKVTKVQWQGMMEQARTPLGKLSSRTVKMSNYITALPNVPKGEYVVVQYDSSFEGMNHAVELVTAYMDNDGKWRVAGYYIKPAGM